LNSISRSACLNSFFYKCCLFLNVRKYTPYFLSFSSSDNMLRCFSIMEFITLKWEQVCIIFSIMTVSFSFSWGLRGYAFMPFTEFVKAACVCSGGRQDYCAMIISMVISCLARDKSMSFGQLFAVISKIFVLLFASCFVFKKNVWVFAYISCLCLTMALYKSRNM